MKRLVLTPVKKDGVIYVDYVNGADAGQLRRWHAFSAERCAGKDAFGKYYDSAAHAKRVISEFRTKEAERTSL